MKFLNVPDFSLLKYSLYRAFTNPVFYVISVLFNLFCVVQLFLIQNFFGGNGTTNLNMLFSSMPFAGIITVPVLCINSFQSKGLVIPVSKFSKTAVSVLSLWIQHFLMCVPLFFVPVFVNLFGTVDGGQAFTGFFTILLYFLTASSFTVFCFEFFSYSVMISVIVSVVLLAVTNAVFMLSNVFPDSQTAAEIVKFFSWNWHFNAAGKGLLDSRDIIYFLTLAVFFLFSAVFVSEYRAGRKFSSSYKFQSCCFCVCIVFLLLDSNRFYFRRDLTASQKYNVSSWSRELLNSTEEQITITYYKSKVLSSLYAEFSDVEDFLTEYADEKKVVLNVKSPEKAENQMLISDYARQIQTRGENKTEYLTVYSVIVIEFAGKTEIIPFTASIDTLEYDLDQKIQKLLTGKERTVNIVCANGLSLFENYHYMTEWLKAMGFSINYITCGTDTLYSDLSGEANVTLVFGQEYFSKQDCADIETYLLDGKKVFFAFNPYKIDFENDWRITELSQKNLQEMIEEYGIFFSTDLINDVSCSRILMQSDTNADGSPAESLYSKQLNYPFWVELLPQENASSGLTLFWPASINSMTDYAFPLLYSSRMSYLVKPDFDSPSNLFITNPFDVEKLGYNPQSFPQQNYAVSWYFSGPLNTVYNKNRGGSAEFMVIPDSLFPQDLMLGYIGESYNQLKNLDFITSCLLKLNGEKELAQLLEKSKSAEKQYFWKVTDEENFNQAKRTTLVYSFIVIPVFYLISFILVVYLRKRFKERLCRL